VLWLTSFNFAAGIDRVKYCTLTINSAARDFLRKPRKSKNSKENYWRGQIFFGVTCDRRIDCESTVLPCPHCKLANKEIPETTRHYPLKCLAYAKERQPLINKFSRAALSIKFLLTETKSFPLLLKYISSTEQFMCFTDKSTIMTRI
jgi:hypothetical protein